MALPASDNFTGTDHTALSANWTTGTSASAPEIFQNKFSGASTATDYEAFWNADTFGNDQYSQADATVGTNGGDECGVTCRMQSGARSYYEGKIINGTAGSGTVRIRKVVAGTPTNLASVANYTWTAGHTLKLSSVGTLLTVYDNGSSVTSNSGDAAFASGQAGARVRYAIGQAETDAQLDNWSADNIVSGVKTRSRTLAAIGTRAGSRQVQAV